MRPYPSTKKVALSERRHARPSGLTTNPEPKMPNEKKKRRSPEEVIADIEAKLNETKRKHAERAAAKTAKVLAKAEAAVSAVVDATETGSTLNGAALSFLAALMNEGPAPDAEQPS